MDAFRDDDVDGVRGIVEWDDLDQRSILSELVTLEGKLDSAYRKEPTYWDDVIWLFIIVVRRVVNEAS